MLFQDTVQLLETLIHIDLAFLCKWVLLAYLIE